MPDARRGADLYDLAPSDFTAARATLVKRLRAAGDRDEAALVQKLRRPSLPAWALNRVARDRPHLVGAVLDAGASLRAATERALAGDASDLRLARGAERRAVDEAVRAAAQVLAGAGHPATEAARRRMAATLRAAIVDGAVAAELRAGTLAQDEEASGFGLDAFAMSPRPTGATSTPARDDSAEHELAARRAALHAEVERLQQEAERLRAEAGRAERRALEARAAAAEAAEAASEARSRLEDLHG